MLERELGAVADRLARERDRRLDDGEHVDRPEGDVVHAREREEIAHDRPNAIHALERDLEHLAALARALPERREQALRDLDVVEHVAERVVHLVGDARGEHADRRHAIRHEQLLLQTNAIGHVAPDDEPRWLAFEGHVLRGRDLDDDDAPVARDQTNLAELRHVRVDRLAHTRRDQLARFGLDEIEERLADDRLERFEAEALHVGAVHPEEVSLPMDDDEVGYPIEQIEELRGRSLRLGDPLGELAKLLLPFGFRGPGLGSHTDR